MIMDYKSMPKREIWPFLKGSHISETEVVTPIKTGVHAHDISTPTCINFLSRFRSIKIFHDHGLHAPKGNLAVIER